VIGNDGIAWEEDIAERARLDLEAFDAAQAQAQEAETQG
jgi:hypothetical protein